MTASVSQTKVAPADAAPPHGDGAGAPLSELPDGPPADPQTLIRAPVLVLNLNYVPVNVCTVRRAVVMVDKGKAELLEQHEGRLHTVAGPSTPRPSSG